MYDGHSGKGCADFLKENLYSYIFTHKSFPFKPKEAIFFGFQKADCEFLSYAKENVDISGSCALVVFVIGDVCLVANAGDSRAIISLHKGKATSSLSTDHQPGEPSEYERIVKAGGKVYKNYLINTKDEYVNVGPFLVSPGKLHVSRAFGDIDAKDEDYGGNPLVLISKPDIKTFKIKHEHDFVVLASGVVFEQLSNSEIVDIVFATFSEHSKEEFSVQLVMAVDAILNQASVRVLKAKATVIIIALRGIKQFSEELKENERKTDKI